MTMRKAEIRALLRLTPEEVCTQAGKRLTVCPDLDTLHRRMAEEIADEIAAANARQAPCRLILPVGPTGQYPFLAERIGVRRLDLSRCYFFFMDEYCDESGAALEATHPLSFKGIIERTFLAALPPDHALSPDRVIFPDEHNIGALPGLIESIGGIDTCYGGIGIHGHVAFNEPSPNVADLPARKVALNAYTITINAIRAGVGGNLECFPTEAYTLGMREILAARRIRLYCRNGAPYDWANTVLRVALLGTPGDDYPVTHIRGRDYHITTDEDTLQSPVNLL